MGQIRKMINDLRWNQVDCKFREQLDDDEKKNAIDTGIAFDD